MCALVCVAIIAARAYTHGCKHTSTYTLLSLTTTHSRRQRRRVLFTTRFNASHVPTPPPPSLPDSTTHTRTHPSCSAAHPSAAPSSPAAAPSHRPAATPRGRVCPRSWRAPLVTVSLSLPATQCSFFPPSDPPPAPLIRNRASPPLLAGARSPFQRWRNTVAVRIRKTWIGGGSIWGSMSKRKLLTRLLSQMRSRHGGTGLAQ